jgi:hypothetical protein
MQDNQLNLPGHLFSFRNDRLVTVLFFLLLGIMFLTRVMMFVVVNMHWVDTDQPIMWLAARNMADGLFYEPRFYGQNYNTLMEGLLAAPLLWLKIPCYYAIPAVTHLLFLFPLVFPAIYLFYHNYRIHALLLLSFNICMPTGYDILNSIPRGFVTGLFFTAFFVPGLLNPKNVNWFLLNLLMAITGYFVNPNSVLVSAPLLFYFFLVNYKDKKTYFIILAGLAVGLIMQYFFDGYYLRHPERTIYSLNTGFGFNYFFDNISHLDERFGLLSPFTENKSFILLVTMALLPFFLFKYNRKAGYSYFILLTIISLAFFVEKTIEGRTWPFYSYSRMYMGLAIILPLFLVFIPIRPGKWMIVLILPVLFAAFKYRNLDEYVASQTDGKNAYMVPVIPLSTALDAIELYHKKYLEKKASLLLLSSGFWLHNVIGYGGPAIHPDFKTQITLKDRRYWVREPNRNKVIERFLYLSPLSDLNLKIPRAYFNIEPIDQYGLYLVMDNKLKTIDFIETARAIEWGIPLPNVPTLP